MRIVNMYIKISNYFRRKKYIKNINKISGKNENNYLDLINFLLAMYYYDSKKIYTRDQISKECNIHIDVINEIVDSLLEKSFLVETNKKSFSIKYEGIVWLHEVKNSLANNLWGFVSSVGTLLALALALISIYDGEYTKFVTFLVVIVLGWFLKKATD